MKRMLCLVSAVAAVAAPARTRGDPAVQLPTFTVSEPRLLPQPEAWRHGRVPGFEILSADSDRDTQRLIHDFLLFQRAVGLAWPAARRNFDLPVYLVFCAGPKQFAEFAPAGSAGEAGALVSVTLRDREQAAIVVDLKTAESEAEGGAGLADYSRKVLRGEYAHFLLSRMQPPPPAWLEAALDPIFSSLVCTDDAFGLPASRDGGNLAGSRAPAAQPPPPGSGRDPAVAAAIGAGALLPMNELFRDHPLTLASEEGVWGRQCYRFAHLCLLGERERLAGPFLEFSLRAATRGADEAAFRECFGMGYDDMLNRIWAYPGFAEDRSFAVKGPGGGKPEAPPRLDLAAATDAEVGRIKGDILRMGKRGQDSHLSLIAPYVRGSRDPELLAALGLEEYAAGRTERAGRFLAAATSAGTRRARAWLELARLRFEAARARPAGADGAFSLDQLVAVLQPLAEARRLPPPLVEVYALFADAWERSPVRPKRDNLMLVDDGVAYFPYDTALVLRDAQVRAKFGYADDAAALARAGLRFAADGPDRDRLLRLQATLAPADSR